MWAPNEWNEFQKATKGQFASRAEAGAVWKAWDKGTFPTKLDSITYHWGKHGKGRTLVQYTADARAFWNATKSAATWGIWNPKWSPAWRIKIPPRGGYFTANGDILTFWD